MGPTSLSVFLYAASETASRKRWPHRPVAGLGAPVSGNSIPCRAATARHGWGGSECETASGSTARSASRSIGQSDGQRPRGQPPAAWPTGVSASCVTWVAGPGSLWAEAPPVPSCGTSRTTGTPSSWRPLRPGPLPTGVFQFSTTGWPVGAAAPVVVGCLVVS